MTHSTQFSVSSCQTNHTPAHPLSRDWPEGETRTSHWKAFIMKIILQCINILWIWQHFGCFIKTIFLFYQQMVWISSRRCKFLLHHFGIFMFCCRHYPSRYNKCIYFNIWMHVAQNQLITRTTWFQLKKKTNQTTTKQPHNSAVQHREFILFSLSYSLATKGGGCRCYSKWNQSSTPDSYTQLWTYAHLSFFFSSDYFPDWTITFQSLPLCTSRTGDISLLLASLSHFHLPNQRMCCLNALSPLWVHLSPLYICNQYQAIYRFIG